jgi:hypothetical protein
VQVSADPNARATPVASNRTAPAPSSTSSVPADATRTAAARAPVTRSRPRTTAPALHTILGAVAQQARHLAPA